MGSCPTDVTLRLLIAGGLDPLLAAELESHIEGCGPCQDSLALITEDAAVGAWRETLASPPESANEALIRELKERGPTTYSEESQRNGSDGRATHEAVRFPGAPSGRGPLGRLGPYHIESLVGEGGAGFVYRAFDESLGRTVALKILRPDVAALKAGRARFEREARAIASVRHDHVVEVYHVGSAADFDLPFFVMEYVEGESLATLLRSDGAPNPREAAELVRQVALGLAAVHAGGLIHRDVKPSNVLIDARSGRARLTDFGISRLVVQDSIREGLAAGGNGRFTHSGQIVGTLEYLSPEQVTSSGQVGIASDVYQLGVVLYELLTGEPPFHGATTAVIRQVLEREPRPPRVLDHRIPCDLETIALACLEKDPARRYPSAVALAADLGRWLGGMPILARPVSRRVRLAKWMRRHPSDAAFVGALGLAIVGFLATVLALNGRLRSQNIVIGSERDAAEKARKAAEALRHESLDRQQVLAMTAAERLAGDGRPGEAAFLLQGVPPDRRGWEWDRLGFQLGWHIRPTARLGEHEWGIAALLSSPDGKRVVSSGQDGRVLVWDADSHENVALRGGNWSKRRRAWCHFLLLLPGDTPADIAEDCFTGLCWLDEARTLVGCSWRGKVVAWDVVTRRERPLFSHERPLWSILPLADGRSFLCGDDRGTLLRWNKATGLTQLGHLAGESPVLVMKPVGPSGCVVGQADGRLSLVDLSRGTVRDGVTLQGPVCDLDVDPSGRIAVACGGETIPIYQVAEDLRHLRRVHDYLVPPPSGFAPLQIHAVHFAGRGEQLLAGDASGRILLWNRGDDRPSLTLADPNGSCYKPDQWEALPPPMRRRFASFVTGRSEGSVITAGASCTIYEWDLRDDPRVTSFRSRSRPILRFDRDDPAQLWVASGDGYVALVDGGSGKLLSERRASPAKLIDADRGRDSDTFVTCGADRTIHFWRRANGGIVSVHQPIVHGRDLLGIAVSPDGETVAASDAERDVHLWDARTGMRRRSTSLRGGDGARAKTGRLAFNADGSVLAVCWPGDSFFLLDAADLSILDQPHVVSGAGGTALAWHPQDPRLGFAGDAVGGIRSFPPQRIDGMHFKPLDAQVAGLAFTPAGDRLAVAAAGGAVRIIDYRRNGPLLTLRSPFGASGTILFDPTGRRLVQAHDDGRLVIWNTGPPTVSMQASPPRKWNNSVLLSDSGEAAREILLRPASVRLDERDRLCLLFVQSGGQDSPATCRTVMLGHETASGFRTKPFADAGGTPETSMGDLLRSLALLVRTDEILGTVRRPLAGTKADFLLVRRSVAEGAPTSSEKLCEEPEDRGFDAHLFVDHAGNPTVLHYSYDRYYLLRARLRGGRWSTDVIGRQGDGLLHQSIADSRGRIHSIFFQQRFPAETRGPILYLRSDDQGCLRDQLDDGRWVDGDGPRHSPSLALNPRDEPAALFTRRAHSGQCELVFARRHAKDWQNIVLATESIATFSNLACDREGRFWFAYQRSSESAIRLASGDGVTWKSESVWQDSERYDPLFDRGGDFQLALLIDRPGQPVIIAARSGTQRNWLRIIRLVR